MLSRSQLLSFLYAFCFARDDDELNFTTPQRVERLLAAWRERWPSPKSDSINVWDDVVTTRAVLLEKLNERFSKYWEKEMVHYEQLIERRDSSGTLSILCFMSLLTLLIRYRRQRSNPRYQKRATG